MAPERSSPSHPQSDQQPACDAEEALEVADCAFPHSATSHLLPSSFRHTLVLPILDGVFAHHSMRPNASAHSIRSDIPQPAVSACAVSDRPCCNHHYGAWAFQLAQANIGLQDGEPRTNAAFMRYLGRKSAWQKLQTEEQRSAITKSLKKSVQPTYLAPRCPPCQFALKLDSDWPRSFARYSTISRCVSRGPPETTTTVCVRSTIVIALSVWRCMPWPPHASPPSRPYISSTIR